MTRKQVFQKHDALNKRRQFITEELGEAKLKEVITAVGKLIDEQQILPAQLIDVIQYRQSLDVLPDL
ncbi:hypothetical protein [Lacticaseibacillus saniviri]|uniref:hypothetical protein n=1 Tax=Lacticaseibacillus saniviri TaxID=931533 RepID=UPI0006CF8E7A|nr:hypothetical protein [Lacticaseibacillus saniviri]